MVPGQRRAGEVVKAPGAVLAPIALPVRLGVVAPVADHRVTATSGTAHARGPAMRAHKREAFGVVQQPREVDQVECRHTRQSSLHDGTRQSAAAIITSEAPRDRYPAPQHPGSQQEPSGIRNTDRLERHESRRRTMAQVADHLSVLALEQQYRSCTDGTAARHFQTIWLLAKGHDLAQVSATVSFARRWVEIPWVRLVAPGSLAEWGC